MRIDTHQHFWRYDPHDYAWIDESLSRLRRDFLPEESAREMPAVGFDGCIAVQARQTADETPWLLELAERHPTILGVVGWVDLQSPDVGATLETFAQEPRLVGLRHVVQSEPDGFLDRPAFLSGLSQLAALDLTYDILIYERQMPAALELVRRFPAQSFVLDHLGKPDVRHGRLGDWVRQLRALAAHENVVCKLSGLITEAEWSTWTPARLRPYIEAAAECFSPARLMMGSDWPVCTVAGTYAETMALVTDVLAGWSTGDRDAVLGGTAARVWKLEPRAAPQAGTPAMR